MNPIIAIQKLRNVIRRKHLSLSTEQSYVYWLDRFILAIKSMPVSFSSEQNLEHFLSTMARNGNISASTQHQAFNAILFFYKHVLNRPLQGIDALRISRPVHLRHAPSLSETRALLRTVQDVAGYPTNLVARFLYGCGMRVSEPLNLRIKDVNLEQFSLCVRGAKGGKDRKVSLPLPTIPDLKFQMEVARSIWRRDCENRLPVALPQQLSRKFPEYQFIWQRAWLFPARRPCRDPRTHKLVRYRMHEANVQRAIKEARRKLGIMVLPHELRHGYATHCLERGVNPRAIQEAMGHNSLETTMGYLHAESLSVKSPLEVLESLASQ